MSEKIDDAEVPPASELDESELQAVVGGDAATSTPPSNTMKTKHDTAKNTISNIH